MINTEDVYFLTYLGKGELDAPGTSLSRSELKLLVLIDGKATVSQVQASAGELTAGAVLEILQRLLRSEHIALQQFGMGDFFGASATGEPKAEMPSDSAIENGVATLQQDGYAVRIARRPPSDRKLARDKKLTVVVVEDEPQLAENMRIVLTHAGFVVRVAANREQIVAAFRQPPLPDLVLLDVTLPDTDGFEVLAKIRLNPMLREVPVIMVTGAATREAVVKGLRGDANGYVTKPFQISVLVKAVKTVLGIEAGDQIAVSASSRSTADSARPGGEPVAPAVPSAPAAAPKAPVADAAPPSAQLADTEVFNASPGSLLARLREAAQAKQREEQKPAQKEQFIPLVSGAVEKTYRHLKQVATLLNSAKPAYAQTYTFQGLPNFDDLKWDSVHLDFRTREVSPTSKAFEQVTLHYHLAAKKALRVVREPLADEKLKQALSEARIEFDTQQQRNQRGSVVGTIFIIPCEVKASLRLVGDFKTGKLTLKMRNVEHFGTLEHTLSAEAITEESLNELSRYILGESRRIGPLLLKHA
jgi:CheY-like chemotaxis protein